MITKLTGHKENQSDLDQKQNIIKDDDFKQKRSIYGHKKDLSFYHFNKNILERKVTQTVLEKKA